MLIASLGSLAAEEDDALKKLLGNALTEEEIERRGPEDAELIYARGSKEPFTGWLKSMHDNGKVHLLVQGKSGKADGDLMVWHENGQIAQKTPKRNGVDHGLRTAWFENGQKSIEGQLEKGKWNGIMTEGDEAGHILRKVRYVDGVLSDE